VTTTDGLAAALQRSTGADAPPATRRPRPWIAESALLARAYVLAESSHRSQTRATDGRPFLDHVVEVATLLQAAGFDEDLVAAGLLHDAVERGTLSQQGLRSEMPEGIASLVLALTEDTTIDSFDARKTALRQQVASAGGPAVTVFAADKLSDILGLQRGIATFGAKVEERMGTSVSSMAGHYRDSVEMIASSRPGSTFLPALRVQLDRLAALAT
jgi:hypothetical protein